MNLPAAALVSAVVPSLFAQTGTGPQLAIVSGGARIVDRDPGRHLGMRFLHRSLVLLRGHVGHQR
jgi:hypothetical protein